MTSQSTATDEHGVVVGHDAPVDVEDPSPLGHQPDGLGLAGVDDLLQRVGLHGLQEPQARPHGTEQQRGHEGEDAQAGGALVSSHGDSLTSGCAIERAVTSVSCVLPERLPLGLLDAHAPATDGDEQRAEDQRAGRDHADDHAVVRVEGVVLTDEGPDDGAPRPRRRRRRGP